jgi:DNA-binding CsgD family transcriptional regulator
MVHLMIFLLIISLGLGLGSITVSTQSYSMYKLKFLKYFTTFVITLNLAVILNLLYNYFKGNMKNIFSWQVATWIELSYRFSACILLVFVFGSAIYMLHQLTYRTPCKKYINALKIIWVILVAIFLASINTMFTHNKFPIPVFINIAIDKIGIFLVFVEIIRALYYSKNIKDLTKKTYIKWFLAVFGGMWFSIMTVETLGAFGYISVNTTNFISATLFIFMNLLPILLLKPFLKKAFGEISENILTVKPSLSLEDLYRRYDISNREKEIINLICMGKTNQEIADELFISIYTVKDHNHRIYKKLGVSNRVQVTNIFKFNQ